MRRVIFLLLFAWAAKANHYGKRSIAGQMGEGVPVDSGMAGTVTTSTQSEYYSIAFTAPACPPGIETVENVRKISVVPPFVIILVKTSASKTEVLRKLRIAGIVNYKVEYSVQHSFTVSWDLDRIDQPVLPLNGHYTSVGTAPGSHLYIVDTGVRATHDQFTGRVVRDFNVIGEPDTECDTHGSWVAGLAAGLNTGTATSATIHDLKVARSELNCAFYTSDGIDALLWILENGTLPGVINLSWQGPGNVIIDTLVDTLYAAGFVVVTAAGNAGSSLAACINSPARAGSALSVGATNPSDYLTTWSNYGSCVDIYAPGSNVIGAGITNDYGLVTLSGTSGSSPIVAGIAAVYYSKFGYTTAEQVTNKIRDTAIYGVIHGLAINSGNRFVNINSVIPPPPSPPAHVNAASVLSLF
jgi:subtilisin family serine protease